MNEMRANHPGTRDLLGRVGARRTRALPPLDQIRRSVDSILTKWQDVMQTPEDRDRDKLAREKLFRIANWKWEEITTQRVISAAVAVFDQDRRAHPDFAPEREFYLSEIETREPGVFSRRDGRRLHRQLCPWLRPHPFPGQVAGVPQRKRKLAEQALWPMGDSGADVSNLTEAIAASSRGQHAVIADSMAEQFRRDGLSTPTPSENGSYELT